MSNRRFFTQHAAVAGVAAATTILVTPPGAGEKIIVTRISVYNATTAMTGIEIRKTYLSGAYVVLAQEPGVISTNTAYWYDVPIVVNYGPDPLVTPEQMSIVLNGTALNDVIGYYVEGYYATDNAWNSEEA
jgi:hypothetical protein